MVVVEYGTAVVVEYGTVVLEYGTAGLMGGSGGVWLGGGRPLPCRVLKPWKARDERMRVGGWWLW